MKMTLTTNRPESSYGMPVLLDEENGIAYGPGDPLTQDILDELFGPQTAADFVRAEMEHWRGKIGIAAGFGPWNALVERMPPPFDPDLAERFCGLPYR